MKFLKLIAILLVLTIGYSEAQTNRGKDVSENQRMTNKDLKSNIQNLIEKIKQAPPDEKYIYVNKLKLIIKELNAKERRQVIERLRKQLRDKRRDRERNYNHREHRHKAHNHSDNNSKNYWHNNQNLNKERNLNRDREFKRKEFIQKIKEKLKERRQNRERNR